MNQTREEKIEMFDKNQQILWIEEGMFFPEDKRTDLKRVKDIFLRILDKHSHINVVNLPVFTYEEKLLKVVTRLAENENDIVEYFSKFKQIFMYTLSERPWHDDTEKLVVRFTGIPRKEYLKK